MIPSAALLALLLSGAPAMPKSWLGLELAGWTRDGSAIAWKGTDPDRRNASGEALRYLLITDHAGRPTRIFKLGERGGELSPCTKASCPGAAWRAAESEEAAEEWRAKNPVEGPAKSHPLGLDAPTPIGELRGRSLSLSLGRVGADCPRVSLRAQLGTVSAPVGEDRCASGPGTASEKALTHLISGADVAWSPDGSTAAVAWRLRRAPASGDGPEVLRSHPLVVARRSLAVVDLLDAGAGARAKALAARLEKAGFAVLHRGRADRPRATTEIAFAAGFEVEAREVAGLLGATAGSTVPQSGKSPYALIVAAGRK
jgi:hypothetical protein